MLGLKQRHDLGILMTRDAGIRPLAAVGCILTVCRLRGGKQESGKTRSLYKHFHHNRPPVKSVKEKSANAVYFFHVSGPTGTMTDDAALDA